MTDKNWTIIIAGAIKTATRMINGKKYIINYRNSSYGTLQTYNYTSETYTYLGVGAVSTLKKKALAMSKT